MDDGTGFDVNKNFLKARKWSPKLFQSLMLLTESSFKVANINKT